MEEDIKILEQLMITLEIKHLGGGKELANLIKGYRGLEEKQKSYDISYNLGKAFANKQWETKVKGKMEELDKQLEEADELDPYKWVPLTHKKEVLQELMEEK